MVTLFAFIKKVFSLHTRSLSWLRIWLWVLLLFDLIRRTVYFDALILETGLVPFDLMYDHNTEAAFWSVYMFLKAQRRTILMFVVHWIVVICFIAGWKTKEMSILVRIFSASLYGRNSLVINGGDTLMRVILFWCMFLPLGEHYSIDAKQKTGKREGTQWDTIWNIATIGFIVQLLSVYVFTFLMKTDPIWTEEFTAIYYALSLDAFRTTLGDRLYTMPNMMYWLTALVYIFEWYGALLLFVPWCNHQRRKVSIILFIAFHLWLMSTMHLGPFPFIAIVCRLALWPSGSEPSKRYGNNNVLLNGFLVTVIALSMCWNIRTLDFDYHQKRFPRTVNNIVFALRIEQSWSMFAPYPFKDDGWYTFTATDDKGIKRIINKELPGISYDEKGLPDRSYTSEIRNKYYSNMRSKKYSYVRMPFLNYACKTIPGISHIRMDFVREYTLPNYEYKPHETVRLATITCP